MDTLDALIEQVQRAGRTLKFYGPQNIESIQALEKALSVKLPPSYVAFLRRFGGGGEGASTPIAGIYENQPMTEGVGSVYGETILAREDYRLPSDYIVIYSDDEIKAVWCIDMRRTMPDGECPVVSFDVNSGSTNATIAPTFGSFFEHYLQIRANKPGEINSPASKR